MKRSSLFLSLLLLTPAWAVAQTATSPAAVPPPAPEIETETEKPAAPKGTKAEQYAEAQKRLTMLKLHHEEDHPTLVKQRATVARLQQEAKTESEKKSKSSPSADSAERLTKAKENLTKLLEKYTDKHPVVIEQKREIAELEKKVARDPK
ncbi:MAG: hypothetical protein V4773_17330 [Verrucomicrobiota bacterium]